MVFRDGCAVLVVAIALIAGGCRFYPEQPPAQSVTRTSVAQSATAQPAASDRDKTIARLLSDADYALSRNQLLTPIEDNAFDRYQSVLIMDSLNTRARAGLQAVSLRYAELARNSISRGQFAQARGFLDNAGSIDPSSQVVAETREYLRRQMAAQPAAPAISYKPGPGEHMLDAQALTRKSPKIIAQLTRLANQARETGELVIIHARNDAEGRWIYSQMRDALEDFLLRGDIRIAKQPRIQFVPVL